MKKNLQNKAVSYLPKIAVLLLISALSACGGGSSDSGNSTPVADKDNSPTPAVSDAQITRLGLDYLPNGVGRTSDGGDDIGKATVDANGNITLSRNDTNPEGNQFIYNFTFPSGMPGGSIKTNLFSTTLGGANKEVKILAPNATAVQNVFWRNADNPYIGGFAEIGHPTDLSTLAWPASGTATYSGKGFQYLIEYNNGIASNALYTSDVIATVDYAAQTITIVAGANPTLVDSLGNFTAIDPSRLASTFAFTGITYTTLKTESYSESEITNGLGWSHFSNEALGFFGSNAEEFSAVIEFSTPNSGATTPFTPVPTTAPITAYTQYLSLALRKQ